MPLFADRILDVNPFPKAVALENRSAVQAHIFYKFNLLKNSCVFIIIYVFVSPVGFKGNLPLLEICLFLSRGLSQMEVKQLTIGCLELSGVSWCGG